MNYNEINPYGVRTLPDSLDRTFGEFDPKDIIVDRENRQRKEVSNVTDLEISILKRGQIEPIVITRDMRLVVGERRLCACKNLEIKVKAIFIDTLDETELKCIEFDENLKRKDLTWREIVNAVGSIHKSKTDKHGAAWGVKNTAEYLGYVYGYVLQILYVYKRIDLPQIANVTDIKQAIAILRRIDERKTVEIVNDIIKDGQKIFGKRKVSSEKNGISSGSIVDSNSNTINLLSPRPISNLASTNLNSESNSFDESRGESKSEQLSEPLHERTESTQSPILNGNFHDWAKDYSGVKFNLIHCDFPYGTLLPLDKRNANYSAGEGVYKDLLNTFCTYFNNFASYSCHIIFWFSMNFFIETRKELEKLGLWIFTHPLIWVDTSNNRIVSVPGRTPGQIYHSAFFCMRGERPLVKTVNDAYPAPAIRKPIHPTQKPEPMLRYFLSSVVDETTRVFDPTCGSASALIAAEDLGAKEIYGIELDPEHAAAANAAIHRARLLRQAQRS